MTEREKELEEYRKSHEEYRLLRKKIETLDRDKLLSILRELIERVEERKLFALRESIQLVDDKSRKEIYKIYAKQVSHFVWVEAIIKRVLEGEINGNK